MKEMKTIKFPGDAEPREIVDAKVRAIIGTADISVIGDGTVKGAILALLEMIKSGGGVENNGDCFTIQVGSQDDYLDAPAFDMYEVCLTYKVSDEILTLEQLQKCYMVCIVNGVKHTFTEPAIEQNKYYGNIVKFAKVDGTDLERADVWQGDITIATGEEEENHEPGTYITFYFMEEILGGEIESATIYVPTDSSDDTTGDEDTDSLTIEVKEESYYGDWEADMLTIGEYSGWNITVDYENDIVNEIPSIEQLQSCSMECTFDNIYDDSDSVFTLTSPRVEQDTENGGYRVYFDAIQMVGTDYVADFNTEDPLMFVKYDNENYPTAGVYVFFSCMETHIGGYYEEELKFKSGIINLSAVSSSASAEAITIELEEKAKYAYNETVEPEIEMLSFFVSEKVPQLEQLQNSTFELTVGSDGWKYRLEEPEVEESSLGYDITYKKIVDLGTHYSEDVLEDYYASIPEISIVTSDDATNGIYVCFSACEKACSIYTEAEESFVAGTIYFPEVTK